MSVHGGEYPLFSGTSFISSYVTVHVVLSQRAADVVAGEYFFGTGQNDG